MQIGVVVSNGRQETALIGIFRVDCEATFSALQECLAVVQPKPALLFRTAVAFVAMFDEKRANFGFEEFELLGGDGWRGRCRVGLLGLCGRVL